jgi:hypothetical protein
MSVARAPVDTGAADANQPPFGQKRAANSGPRRRRLLTWADRHPLGTVALLAAVARGLAVVLLGPLRPGVTVPDEQQYLDLAASVAAGRGAEAWQPGYGQSLYDSTATFMRPLTFLTRAFGEHQLNGQLLAAVFGVLTATLTTWLALRVVRTRYAWLAGLVVALVPSQVFWSSVVLRESMVWAGLAGLGLATSIATSARSWRLLTACAALVTLCLWALADLRGQTAVVAGVALVLATLVARSARRAALPLGALALAVLVPWGAGLGPGGFFFLEQVVPQLGVIRTNLSIGADSAFIDRTPLPPVEDPESFEGSKFPLGADPPGASGKPRVPGDPGSSEADRTPDDGAPRSPGAPAPPRSATPGAEPDRNAPVVTAPSGEQFLVDDSAGASLSALPRGLLAVIARPFPWEPARNGGLLLAKVENAGWMLLYLLAAVGVLAGWRRRNELAFPLIVTGAVLAVASVSQANLGTAFRHRGQVLWALAVLAAVGAQYLVDRRRRRAA